MFGNKTYGCEIASYLAMTTELVLCIKLDISFVHQPNGKKDDDYPGNFDLFLLPTFEVIVTRVDSAIFKRSNGNMFL